MPDDAARLEGAEVLEGNRPLNVGPVIAAYRAQHRYGVREMAKIIGVSAATLNRIERGENCDGRILAKIITWLLSEVA